MIEFEKRLIIPPTEDDEDSRDLGVVQITEKEIIWREPWGHSVIYRSTWEQWALEMAVAHINPFPPSR